MASRLPRSFPSAVQVNAAGIEAFLDALSAVELHSLMVLRHGRVIAEGWWRPYVADEIQLGYSLSKSITSVALSYVLDDGLICLDDPVIGILGANPDDQRYGLLTVADLARMTTGHLAPPDFTADWPPLDEAPGRTWTYNNWATLTLARIIQQVTGMKLTSLLERRLFEPLDIEDWAWREHDGVEVGFTGLHLTTESWAKFGHLLLRRGELWDRQVINETWVDQATHRQADNSFDPAGQQSSVDPDSVCGYGYQFWVSRHGFRAAGAKGQLVVVLPDQDLVLVTTAATECSGDILEAIWTHLLPAIGPDARGQQAGRPERTDADLALASRLSQLTLQPISSSAPDQAGVFVPSPHPQVIGALERMFVTGGDRCWNLDLRLGGKDAQLTAGDGRWVENLLPVPGCDPMRLGMSAGWTGEDEFTVEARTLHTPHGVLMVCDATTGLISSSWLSDAVATPDLLALALPEGLRHRVSQSR